MINFREVVSAIIFYTIYYPFLQILIIFYSLKSRRIVSRTVDLALLDKFSDESYAELMS